MKLTQFPADHPIVQLTHSPTDSPSTTNDPVSQSMHWGTFSPGTELFILSIFSLLLFLILRGSRTLCFAVYHKLSLKYRNYRLSVLQQQVATLERAFQRRAASRERS